MKKTAIIILCLILSVAILNLRVVTRQGVDGNVRKIGIPLYLKALDYLDRHYNYARLVSNIIGGVKDRDERILRILDWAHANIRDIPPGFPIADDHPLNIIIRGYGTSDQFEDIFTILCYYSGTKAFYVYLKNSWGKGFLLSFVKMPSGWSPMSACYGMYVRKGNRAATLKDITDDPSLLEAFTSGVPGFEEKVFFDFIKSSNFDDFLTRTTAQSPFGRASYAIQRFFSDLRARI